MKEREICRIQAPMTENLISNTEIKGEEEVLGIYESVEYIMELWKGH